MVENMTTGWLSLKYYEKSGSKMRKYLFEAGVDIIFAKKKEMDFMQFLRECKIFCVNLLD